MPVTDSYVYMVAIDKFEAKDLANMIGHATLKAAEAHLKEVKAPPTDPYYASQYRVYRVKIEK